MLALSEDSLAGDLDASIVWHDSLPHTRLGLEAIMKLVSSIARDTEGDPLSDCGPSQCGKNHHHPEGGWGVGVQLRIRFSGKTADCAAHRKSSLSGKWLIALRKLHLLPK